MRTYKLLQIILLSLTLVSTVFGDDLCQGTFVNPITGVCWDCLFPLTIGDIAVVNSSLPDTSNPSNPICICTESGFPRIGIAFGYWEPFALEDVTRDPMCMVNIGGVSLPISGLTTQIGGNTYAPTNNSESNGAFYEVHWYEYPLVSWLNIITDIGCMDSGDFNIAYLTEFDPTWDDDILGFVLNPEAILFGNQPAQASCSADAVSATTDMPIDLLFWCMGDQGSAYPLTGNVSNKMSDVNAATLEGEKFNFKMHREALLWDTNTSTDGLCQSVPTPILPKTRYRYQMVNIVPDASTCYPYGHSTMTWESGHDDPSNQGNFGFLVWRKRNCCFL